MHQPQLVVALQWIDAVNRQDAEQLDALSTDDIEIVGPRGSVRGKTILGEWLARAKLTLENQRAFVKGEAVVLVQHGVWNLADVGQADVVSRFVIRGGRVSAYERLDDLEVALSKSGLRATDEVRL